MIKLLWTLIFLNLLQNIRGQTTPFSLEYKPTRPFYAPNPIRYPEPIIRTSTITPTSESTSKSPATNPTTAPTAVTQQIQNTSTEFENRINIPESSKVDEKNTSGSISLEYKPIKPFYQPTVPYPQPHPWFTTPPNRGSFIAKTTTEIKEKFSNSNPSNGSLTNALLQLEDFLEEAQKELLTETSSNKEAATPTKGNNNDTPLDPPNRIGLAESVATPDYYTTQETILTSGILVLDHGKGSKLGTISGLNLVSTTPSNQFGGEQSSGTPKYPLGESNVGFSTPGSLEYNPSRPPFVPNPVRYPQPVSPSDDTNPALTEITTSSIGLDYKPSRPPFAPNPVQYPQPLNHTENVSSVQSVAGSNLAPSFGVELETVSSSTGLDYESSRPSFVPNPIPYPIPASNNENTQSSSIDPTGGSNLGILGQESEPSSTGFDHKPSISSFAPNPILDPKPVEDPKHPQEANLGSNFGMESQIPFIGLQHKPSRPPFAPNPIQYPIPGHYNENTQSLSIDPTGGSNLGILGQESEPSSSGFDHKPSISSFAPNPILDPKPVEDPKHPQEANLGSNFGTESQIPFIGLQHKPSRPPFAPNPIQYPQPVNNNENTQSSSTQPAGGLNVGSNFEAEQETSFVNLQYKPTRPPYVPNPVDNPQPPNHIDSSDSLSPGNPSGVAKPALVSETHLETSSVISLEYKPSRPPFAPNPIHYPQPIDHTHSSSIKPTGGSKPGFVLGMELTTSLKPSFASNPVQFTKPVDHIGDSSSTKVHPGLGYETTPVISLEYKPSRPPYAPNPIHYPRPVGETPSGFTKPSDASNSGSIFEVDFSTSLKPSRPTFAQNPVDVNDSPGGEHSSKNPNLNEQPPTAVPTLEYKPSRPTFVLNPVENPQESSQNHSSLNGESNPESGIGLEAVTTPITLDYKPSRPPFAPNPVFYPRPVTQENPISTTDFSGDPQEEITSSTKTPVVLQDISTPPSLEYKPTRPPYAPNPIQYPQPIRPFTASAIVTENDRNLPLDHQTKQPAVVLNPVVYPGPSPGESNTSSDKSPITFSSAQQPTASSSISTQSSSNNNFLNILPPTVIVSEDGSVILVPEHLTNSFQDILQGSSASNMPQGSISMQPTSNPVIFPEFIQNSTPSLPVEFHKTVSKNPIEKPSPFEVYPPQNNPSELKPTISFFSSEDSSSSSEENSSSSEEDQKRNIPYNPLEESDESSSELSSQPQFNTPITKLLKKSFSPPQLKKDWPSKDASQNPPKLLLSKPITNQFTKSNNPLEAKRIEKSLKKLIFNDDFIKSNAENKNYF